MLPAERQERICQEMEKNKFISIAELVKILDISPSTVRRDLIELESKGLIKRTHGGVMIRSEFRNVDMNYASRSGYQIEEKDRIGKKTAELLADESCIILDTGTTTLAVARHLEPSKNLRVITDSIDIANELRYKNNIEVILMGGVMKADPGNIYGPLALESLADLHCGSCVMGVSGFTLKAGLTKNDIDIGPLAQRMIEISHRLICIADSSKIGVTGLVSVSDVDAIDILVTDEGIDPEIMQKLVDSGVEVVIA